MRKFGPAATAILAIVAALVSLAQSECIVSSDDVCARLGRDACDPSGTDDLCGPCAYGYGEGGVVPEGFQQQTCVPITCTATQDDTSTPTAAFLNKEVPLSAEVTVNCKDGYWASLTRQKTILKVCTVSGVLEGSDECVPVECNIPNDVAFATPESTAPLPVGANVTYTCADGYSAAGKPSVTRVCLRTGALTSPTNCTQHDACAARPCGDAATCTDLPPPAMGHTCTCKGGFLGVARPDGSGCFRLSFKQESNRVVVTASDLELYQPVDDTTTSLRDLLAGAMHLTEQTAQAFPTDGWASDRLLGLRVDGVNARIDALVSTTTSTVSAAKASEQSTQAAIAAEASRAAAAESGFQGAVSSMTLSLAAARSVLAGEVTRAMGAEAAASTSLAARLSTSVSTLASETVRAKAVEAAQQSTVTALSGSAATARTDLTGEVTRAKSVETATSAQVSSLASSLAVLSSMFAMLSTAHTATLSGTLSASTAISAEKTRATNVQAALTSSINALRTDLTGSQGTRGTVSGTVGTRVGTLTSISTQVSSLASQVNSVAVTMLSLQTAASTTLSTLSVQNTQIGAADTSIATQSAAVTSISTSASSLTVTQTSLSSTTATHGTSIASVSTGVANVNARTNAMSATTCDQANGAQSYGFNVNGNPVCVGLSYTYLMNWFNSKCWMTIGWTDSCSGCSNAPAKAATMYGNGVCQGYYGAGSTCGSPAGWASINTDGGVNEDDNFYVRVGCNV